MKQFNKEQKLAITHDKGPLLVIAGAGTGKTTVIVERILNLINTGKVSPSEILALTFTEKATMEMQERIDMALPLSYEEIWIKTFHGFCDNILREYGLEIGLDTGYKIMSNSETWMFIKKHLFEFDFDYYRPLGSPTKFIGALIQHFSRLRDEDVTPEKYQSLVISHQSPDEQAKINELAQAYQKYQELKMAENVMDYADLHFYTLRLFEKRKNILKEYQKRFKYILVDEFQDTNYAQNKIVLALADDHKNIMVVGDDDQAIYKWRGASLVNIMQFEKSFPDAEKVVLTENYRSNQDILDASYSLIKNNNPNRLEVQANVVKKLSGQKNQKNSIEVHPFGHYIEEVDFVVNEAKKMLDQNKTVAILARASALAEPFIEEIKRRSLKYHFSGGASLFMQEEIKDLISILRFIANPTDDIALFRILNFPLFNYRMEFILETMNKARKENTPLFQMLKKQIIFSETTELLSHLIEFSKNKPASRVINEFFEKSEYFKILTANETAENYEKILNISEFSRKVASFERNNKETSTYHFVAYLELLLEASENPEREILDLDPNMIQIMTVHAAKGLEFDAVFLVNLVNHRFPTTNRKDAIEVPKELIIEDLPTEDDHIAEERRLFYVACTRAKEKLFMTYSEIYDGKKAWRVSPFIKEALHNIEKVESRKQKVEKPIIEREHRSLKSFKPVKISYTQLETWQNCPRKYQYRYVYKIPSPSAHSANFGASVHATLNEFYKVLKKGEKPSIELLKSLYEEYWIPYGYESKAHEMSRKKKGIEILNRFYEENSKPAFVLPAYLERAFSLKMVSESSAPILLLGRIDRIDKLPDGTYEVIDYKTGKLKKQTEINKDLQLSIYARACRDIYKLPISKLSFYFLEDNQKISTTRSNEDLKNLETLVKEECEKIAVADFKPTPGFPCSYCEYCILCNACKK